MPGEFGFEIDGAKFSRFVVTAKKNVDKGIRSYIQKGGQVLVRSQKQQAAKRFGTETSQSRMQSVDPARPKGHYAATVRALLKGDEMWVGPDAPYDWWIEKGSDAGKHIPRTHRDSSFIGHRPVKRSIKEGRPKLRELFSKEMKGAIHRSVGF